MRNAGSVKIRSRLGQAHKANTKGGEEMKNQRRKIVVYIATSADGYIARADGSVDWLNRPRPPGNYGMNRFMRSIDTIVWGRKTYDQALRWTGGKGTGSGPGIKNFVFSHQPSLHVTADAELVAEPVGAFAERLRASPGKNIWMMGGGGIIGSFLDEGQIDEFSIHMIPTFIGEGIPLLQPRHRLVPLELLSLRCFPDGVVHLNYRVLPRTAGKRSARKVTRAMRS
jgi:dihydrofolate reductase